MSYNDPSKTFHPHGSAAAPSTVPVALEQHEHQAPAPVVPVAATPALPPRSEVEVPLAATSTPQTSRREEGYPISAFVLKQGGAYSASVVVEWTTKDGRAGKTEKLGSSIGFNHTGARSLKNKGIPEGAHVRLTLDVTLGKSASAAEVFIYEEGAPTSAFYTSGGTSLSSEKLQLVYGDE